jgi:hypothetical protein
LFISLHIPKNLTFLFSMKKTSPLLFCALSISALSVTLTPLTLSANAQIAPRSALATGSIIRQFTRGVGRGAVRQAGEVAGSAAAAFILTNVFLVRLPNGNVVRVCQQVRNGVAVSQPFYC